MFRLGWTFRPVVAGLLTEPQPLTAGLPARGTGDLRSASRRGRETRAEHGPGQETAPNELFALWSLRFAHWSFRLKWRPRGLSWADVVVFAHLIDHPCDQFNLGLSRSTHRGKKARSLSSSQPMKSSGCSNNDGPMPAMRHIVKAMFQ